MNITPPPTNCLSKLFRTFGLVLLMGALATLSRAQSSNPVVLKISADQMTAKVSPILHGLMTEEINYSYDGGLYAELIRNRAFRDEPRRDEPKDKPAHWSVAKQGAEGTIRVVNTHPLTDKLPNSLEVEVKAATPEQRLRVVNDGYWGIPIKPNTTYKASFYVQ